MLVCYLDDSGEKRDPFVTLAGYLGAAGDWARFEPRADVFFREAGIEYLHTVDLHQRRGQFDGWNSRETLAFATRFFELVGEAAPVGLEMSVHNAHFNRRKDELSKKGEGSPMTFCFKALLQNFMSSVVAAQVFEMDDINLSFVVESGRRSEPIVQEFNRLKALNAFNGALKSMTLEDKKSFKALQAADFFAFFSRRLRCMGVDHKNHAADQEFFLKATAGVRVHSRFVVTGFS